MSRGTETVVVEVSHTLMDWTDYFAKSFGFTREEAAATMMRICQEYVDGGDWSTITSRHGLHYSRTLKP